MPSPVLELGIDVYDTPGLLFHDHQILKENLKELVHRVRPIIVFLYGNTSFAKDANECYLMIRSVLGDLEQPPTFFLNTKQDIEILFADFGIVPNPRNRKHFTIEKYDEILPKRRLKCYQELYRAIGVANSLPKLDDNISIEAFNEKCDNFDICSIDACSLLPTCAVKMTEQACRRIVKFAVKTEMKKPNEITKEVLDKIDSIFSFIGSASYRTKSQLDDIRYKAETWGENFFKDFKNELSIVTETVQEKILQRFDEHEANMIERAVKLERSNDPLQHKARDISEKNIKDFIEISVQEEVIKFAVNEVVNASKERIQKGIKQAILIKTEKNELLKAAQRHVLIDVSSDDITQRNFIKLMLYQLSIAPLAILRLIKGVSVTLFPDYWNGISLSKLKENKTFYTILDAMDSLSALTDDAKRREFATQYLNKRRSKLTAEKDLYSKNLKLWIEDREMLFNKNIKNNYNLAVSYLNTRKNIYKSTIPFIRIFARLECELLALQDLTDFNEQQPLIDESQRLGAGTHFEIYSAQWPTKKDLAVKSFAVKRLKRTSHNYRYLQYLEAHVHRKITQLCRIVCLERDGESENFQKLHIAPLLYLYVEQRPNCENILWMFLQRYSQSLQAYLENKINEIKADEVLKIAIDMINVLVFLHENEIVHRDIKANNILMDENKQCYLADFGTAQEWITHSTVVGTFPLPPELESCSLYDGRATDVFSFGIFLFELLPKKEYIRPDDLTTITNMFKEMVPLNEYNRIYEELIESCLQPKPEDRPSAITVKSKLLECLVESEKRPCFTCEKNVRKCRFQPCKHKIICQSCYDALAKNENGIVKCIICRQTIDRWTEDENNQTYFG
ncbi:unnamed protein product [Rotaria sordida]|uniref:Protein kinase domain-containing protein n=1 Tax=Rotaria sordida TaxID=392033 RepID=A0A814WCN9_9BILA|nr:unnamed protein product [Rotaria sordida]CAF1445169.1 unnamed protein product [Rotaria sordida]